METSDNNCQIKIKTMFVFFKFRYYILKVLHNKLTKLHSFTFTIKPILMAIRIS